ncbi:hypothetical protein N9O57_00815 [bacterium]|nr:hypothetical protein [bacterium]
MRFLLIVFFLIFNYQTMAMEKFNSVSCLAKTFFGTRYKVTLSLEFNGYEHYAKNVSIEVRSRKGQRLDNFYLSNKNFLLDLVIRKNNNKLFIKFISTIENTPFQIYYQGEDLSHSDLSLLSLYTKPNRYQDDENLMIIPKIHKNKFDAKYEFEDIVCRTENIY